MFYVESVDGSRVELLNNIGTDFNIGQSIDGTFTMSFTCFQGPKNRGYYLLESESIVTVVDNEFRVKQYSNTAHSKTVEAVSVFYDLGKVQQHNTFSGNHTLKNHVNFALEGTGWTAIIDSDIAQATNYIRSFGKSNIVSLVKKICKYHDIEYIILPDKKIHFKKEIGGDYDYQYRYKHYVSSVVLKEDTTNLATIIKGYGADGLMVEYRSPNVAVFGELEAEPVNDERFTNREALLEYIKSQLQDVPELAIESTIPELVEREIGEHVWLIYEPLNIEMKTRILQQTKVLRDGKLITQSVVFGNSLPKTAEDVLVDQKEELDDTKVDLEETKEELTENINETKKELEGNIKDTKKEFQSKIDQTDSRITIEVEQLEKSIATIDVKADNISMTVNNRITNEVAAINIRADQIQSTVTAQNVSIGNLDNRIGSAESSITQQSWQISQKVSTTDYNGNTIASLINQTSTTIDIQASKINLIGAVRVLSDITGDLGTIYAGNIDIKEDIRMGRTLYFSDMTSVGGSNGSILLDALNDITYQGRRHTFWGDTVDFSNVKNIIGLEGGTDYIQSYTGGLGIGIGSNGKFLVVKKHGQDVGYINFS